MSRPPTAYEFGDHRLDPLARVLSQRDRPIALAPKTFDLLRLMIERRGRVLERDELIRELWPDTIVEEANLTFQVSTLRKALGEDGARWIETVPKHGYRFMAPVREVRDVVNTVNTINTVDTVDAVDTVDTVPAAASPARGGGPLDRIAWGAAIAALAVIAAGVASGWLRRDASSEAPSASLSPPRLGYSEAAPLTSYPGWEGMPTLSPDGSQVAFSWDGASHDNLDIYLKLVGPGEPHRLTTHPDADVSPAWSPDGRQIAFLRPVSDDNRRGIFLMPALGGSERRLADIDMTAFGQAPGNFLAWTPDGKWLAAAGRFDLSAPSEVWLLSTETGERRRLTTAGTGQIGDFGMSFSPDGRFLAVLRYATRSVGDVYLLPLDAAAGYRARGPLIRLTDENRLVGGPAWSASGDRIFYSSGGGAMSYRTLRMIPIDPTHPERRTEAVPLPAGEHATALAAAGDRLVYARAQRDANIWRLPLSPSRPLSHAAAGAAAGARAGGGAGAGSTPTLFISSTFDEHNPDFSADGAKVTFTSTRSGTEEIWVANANGSGAEQMTSMGGANTSNSRWSPDGRTILFNSRRTGSSDLYLVHVATRAVERLTDDPDDEYEPRWSRDGRWIYFVSTRSGRPETWKMPAAGGAAVQVTRQGGAAAFESVDGRWLYYAKDTRPMSIWRVPVDGGEETKVLDYLSYNFNFAVTAKGIHLLALRDGVCSIEFFDFTTRKTTLLYTLDRPFWFGFAVAPDEKSLLFSKVDSQSSDLMVVDNLRRR
jgi:Tol biopolymer transport system component/DNA-binding winged helix-turn-helix (wHTH) protein